MFQKITKIMILKTKNDKKFLESLFFTKLSHYNALQHVGYLKLRGKYMNNFSHNKRFYSKIFISTLIFYNLYTYKTKKEIVNLKMQSAFPCLVTLLAELHSAP